jgi:molecular chaperone GrpE
MSDNNQDLNNPAMCPEDEQVNNSEMDELIAQNQELTDKWKRLAADFENYKRRKEVESRELAEYSKEMVVMQLMPSLQSLEQVLNFAPQDDKYKDWLLGLKATIMQLEKTMEELGLVRIKTTGQSFDPNLHEAVEEKDSDNELIMQEVQPGFMLNGKVMIPAKVVVGKINKKGEQP